MASEVAVAYIEAAKELTVELLRKVQLPTAGPKDLAEQVGEAYRIILRAVVKPRTD